MKSGEGPVTVRLRYIAYLTERPDALAAFYRDRFGFAEQARSVEGDISLSDGAIKLALFRARDALGEARIETGLHHVGFAVDSIAKVKARFRRFNPRGVIVPESGRHRGEVRLYDPECNPVSLSEKDFGLAPGKGSSRLTALAFGALDPEVMAGFHAQVLGLTPVDAGLSAASGGRPDRAVSDGAITLAFRDVFAETSGHKPRYGLARCGFSAAASQPVADLCDPDGNSIVFTTRQTAGGELWRA